MYSIVQTEKQSEQGLEAGAGGSWEHRER